MALKAKLNITNAPEEYNVVECEYRLTQKTNTDGLPSDGVKGGTIIVTIVSPEKARFFFEWMLKDDLTHQGMILLEVNANSMFSTAYRRIFFTEAYLIDLYEYFNNQNSKMMTMRLTISASQIQFVDTHSTGIGLDNIKKQATGI